MNEESNKSILDKPSVFENSSKHTSYITIVQQNQNKVVVKSSGKEKKKKEDQQRLRDQLEKARE